MLDNLTFRKLACEGKIVPGRNIQICTAFKQLALLTNLKLQLGCLNPTSASPYPKGSVTARSMLNC